MNSFITASTIKNCRAQGPSRRTTSKWRQATARTLPTAERVWRICPRALAQRAWSTPATPPTPHKKVRSHLSQRATPATPRQKARFRPRAFSCGPRGRKKVQRAATGRQNSLILLPELATMLLSPTSWPRGRRHPKETRNKAAVSRMATARAWTGRMKLRTRQPLRADSTWKWSATIQINYITSKLTMLRRKRNWRFRKCLM